MSLLLGWGLMSGIKIPHQDFALKRQGGLMREGGVFAGHYGITYVHHSPILSLHLLLNTSI